MWIFVTFILIVSSSVSAQFEYLTELGPTKLNNFDGVGSQVVFHWTNDHPQSNFLVKLVVKRNQSGSGLDVTCPDTKVHVIARDDAIPIPNPYSSQSPSTTFNQSHGVVFTDDFVLISANQSIERVFKFNVTSHQGSSHVFVSVFLSRDDDASIDLSGLTKGCKYYADVTVFREANNGTTPTVTWTARSDDVVGDLIKLKRQKLHLFDIHYVTIKPYHNLTRNGSLKFQWHVYPLTDSGGSLSFRMAALVGDDVVASGGNVSVGGCVSRNHLPTRNQSCDGGYPLQLHGYNVTSEWYLPYPQSGEWFLQLYLDGDEVDEVNMAIDVRLTNCVESCHKSEGQGVCYLYQNDELLYSACSCKAGWQGIACTDGSKALTFSEQLLRTLLLTLSNLMFIPCMLLAIYRKFYTESVVYLYVFFMSSFYHACDQPGIVVYCLLPYDTLQYCDFLASISAIWFTLVLLARTNCPKIESWLHVFGCLAISTLVSYDRFDLWTFLIPGLVGGVVVVTSWARKCRTNSACYPSKNIIFFSVIPGIVFALVGFSMYAFVETKDNYYITHSVWHVSMAIAVLFLMPWHVDEKQASNYNIEVNYAVVDNISMSTSRINSNNNNQNHLPSV